MVSVHLISFGLVSNSNPWHSDSPPSSWTVKRSVISYESISGILKFDEIARPVHGLSFDDAIEAIIEAEGRERNPMAKCENAVCLKVLRETFIGFLKMNHLYIYIYIHV